MVYIQNGIMYRCGWNWRSSWYVKQMRCRMTNSWSHSYVECRKGVLEWNSDHQMLASLGFLKILAALNFCTINYDILPIKLPFLLILPTYLVSYIFIKSWESLVWVVILLCVCDGNSYAILEDRIFIALLIVCLITFYFRAFCVFSLSLCDLT